MWTRISHSKIKSSYCRHFFRTMHISWNISSSRLACNRPRYFHPSKRLAQNDDECQYAWSGCGTLHSLRIWVPNWDWIFHLDPNFFQKSSQVNYLLHCFRQGHVLSLCTCQGNSSLLFSLCRDVDRLYTRPSLRPRSLEVRFLFSWT